jgi:hypothetical protein
MGVCPHFSDSFLDESFPWVFKGKDLQVQTNLLQGQDLVQDKSL